MKSLSTFARTTFRTIIGYRGLVSSTVRGDQAAARFAGFAAREQVTKRKMHIQSIPMWEGSSDNYAYLVVDEMSGDAVVIDPACEEE